MYRSIIIIIAPAHHNLDDFEMGLDGHADATCKTAVTRPWPHKIRISPGHQKQIPSSGCTVNSSPSNSPFLSYRNPLEILATLGIWHLNAHVSPLRKCAAILTNRGDLNPYRYIEPATAASTHASARSGSAASLFVAFRARLDRPPI